MHCDEMYCTCTALFLSAGVASLRSSEAWLTEVARLLEVPAELLAEEVAQVGVCVDGCVGLGMCGWCSMLASPRDTLSWGELLAEEVAQVEICVCGWLHLLHVHRTRQAGHLCLVVDVRVLEAPAELLAEEVAQVCVWVVQHLLTSQRSALHSFLV
jgi:hypothetical protein